MFFLYGAGGHAKVVLDILKSQNVEVDCVCDDDTELREFCGLPVFRGENAPAGTAIVSIGENENRREIVEFLLRRGNVSFATAVHARAIVSGSAQIGAGTVVMPGAIVNAGTRVGAHCIINSGASADHDCEIGDFAHVSPGAILCGGVSVGACAWIGAGAVVVQGISVGENSVVGAGAVVVRDVPPNVVAAGVPAKILKNRITPPL